MDRVIGSSRRRKVTHSLYLLEVFVHAFEPTDSISNILGLRGTLLKTASGSVCSLIEICCLLGID